jgi:endonuclease/exonuclease/phosphatase family metal-dependent hydrolase
LEYVLSNALFALGQREKMRPQPAQLVRSFITILLLAATALACGEPTIGSPVPDAGLEADASFDSDAGEPTDASEPIDAGDPTDGSLPDAGPIGDGGPVRVRMLAGNLTTGTRMNYNAGEGIRIFQGLRPDIAMIQEFNYGDNSPATLRGFVDTTFGPEFFLFREPQSSIDTMPNAIISRYPIVESGEWDDPAAINRDLAWARIDVPGPTDLWVMSVHLRTSNATDRNRGATVAVQMLSEVMAPGDLLAFGGDFNTASRTEACITTLSAIVDTSAPYPVDQNNNGNTSAKRSSPLDWLLANSELRALEVPVEIGANSFPSGLVFDSRVYSPLEDVAPVLATDSAATGMQHMAVVRDFLFPQQ